MTRTIRDPEPGDSHGYLTRFDPSNWAALISLANQTGTSVNVLVNDAVATYVQRATPVRVARSVTNYAQTLGAVRDRYADTLDRLAGETETTCAPAPTAATARAAAAPAGTTGTGRSSPTRRSTSKRRRSS